MTASRSHAERGNEGSFSLISPCRNLQERYNITTAGVVPRLRWSDGPAGSPPSTHDGGTTVAKKKVAKKAPAAKKAAKKKPAKKKAGKMACCCK